MRRTLVSLLLPLLALGVPAAAAGASPATPGRATAEALSVIRDAGIAPAAVRGLDRAGLPLVCGTGEGQLFGADGAALPARAGTPLRAADLSIDGLPLRRRAWECIPSVIRSDGVETFRLEVDVNGPALAVTLDGISPMLVAPEPAPLELRDDGLAGDRVAGDHVYTKAGFRYRTSVPMPARFADDPASPANLYLATVGTVTVQDAGGPWSFAQQPGVGLLRSGIFAEASYGLGSPVVAVSDHVVNVQTESRGAQSFLRSRGMSDDLVFPVRAVLDVLPDLFDFFVFLSVDRVDNVTGSVADNYVAGAHQTVRTSYVGTGQSSCDFSGLYGSAGQLQGVNAVDPYERGWNSNFITHELLHQWGSYLSSSLGLRTGAHYKTSTSVGSLLGGFSWEDDGEGIFDPMCTEGASGGTRASPLDLYLMGVLDSSQVPPQRVNNHAFDCLVPIYDYETVTIQALQAIHGPRVPGPESAQRSFRLAFVVESRQRLLNLTEMTFYEILGQHFVRAMSAEQPDPYVGFNWAPVSRFFGPGVALRSDLELGVTAVAGRPPRTAGVVLRAAFPNPSRGSTRVRWEVAPGAGDRLTVRIYDVHGRSVRTLAEGEMGPGSYAAEWDGKDERGARVPAGLYLCRAAARGASATAKLLRLE